MNNRAVNNDAKSSNTDRKTVDNSTTPLLNVHDLSVSFTQYTRGLNQKELKVITNLNVSINHGEILAIVGSSGSGKSLLAHAILGILPANVIISGNMDYKGVSLIPKIQAELRGKEIALIPQSVNFLDPLMKVGKQVRSSVNNGNATKIQRNIFQRYNLEDKVDHMYPFQLSGGMTRRILVSTAIANEAQLIIADEPTPGLDTGIVNETIRTFRELADKGCGIMLITHDIETALKIADRIAVFYAGTTVEIAPVEDFSGNGNNLRHPYSKALWKALPHNDFRPIMGHQPPPNRLPKGCLFAPRCDKATVECHDILPKASSLRGGMVRCIHAS
ncbi:ABC transporter ATP-binding protein [Mobilitalea sibirica]|uniref:Nickel import system ATP-binding protein NikD n=2 Tax=Mobilitalea sibirica TaxID=1462919 RepID=A0A8J7KZC4_9FIRM|nr:ABC transporter ATP-binding protein [Mobilitalea sibirica]MBH1939918.1 ABC transporter ATP-binding protein [Mobilitalea sibirica]